MEEITAFVKKYTDTDSEAYAMQTDLTNLCRVVASKQRENDARRIDDWHQQGDKPKEYSGNNYQRIRQTPLAI